MALSAPERIIASARSQRGVTEQPPGSNNGPQPYLKGWAWCGEFEIWVYYDAKVDCYGICSASTYMIVQNARTKSRLRSEPVQGCLVVWRPGPTGHTEIFIGWADKARRLALTIGGNTGDAVREHVRDVTGAYFAVPPALEAVIKPAAPVYRDTYWWEDPAAEPVRHQLRNTDAARQKDIDEWVAKHGNPGHVRKGKVYIKRGGKKVAVFTWWTGPRKRSPDFVGAAGKVKRDADKAKVEKATGHKLRARSRRVRIS